jgi:Protein of unknown function (DUF3631)
MGRVARPSGRRDTTTALNKGLAQMLSLFDIRSKTIWPPRRGAATKSTKGYTRAQFEAAWESFCPEDGTPAQSNIIKRLGAVAICVGIDFGAISSMTRLPDYAARSIV